MKKKYIFLMIVFLLLFIGASYALWIQNLYQTDENLMATSCFNITMEQANTIGIQNAYPITDEAGRKLTPYTFTIKNNCEAYASYQVNLEVLNTSTLTNLDFVKVMFDTEAPVILSSKEEVTKTIDTATTSKLLFKGGLDVNESKTHSLRLWIDEDVTTEDNVQNTKFVAQIGLSAAYTEKQVKAYDLCIEKYGEESIQCQILLAESDASLCPNVTENGRIMILSKEFNSSLLCSAPDITGTSYYFQGPVENNWVKFGDFYWRIIRINGDDSIRMIYAGDASVIDALDEETKAQVLSNGYDDSTTLYTQIGTSTYNKFWKNNNIKVDPEERDLADNAGIGYMYGNRDAITENSYEHYKLEYENTKQLYFAESYSYDITTDRFRLVNPQKITISDLTTEDIGKYTLISNSENELSVRVLVVNSIIVEEEKTTIGFGTVRYSTTSLEKAQTNINNSDVKEIVDKWYIENMLEYEMYINDSVFCNDRRVAIGNHKPGYSNLGYGTEPTVYRIVEDKRFNCPNKNDRFTVNDVIIGNGDLTYPIGLITADEAWISGGAGENNNYYLYTGYHYWTMTPYMYNGRLSWIRVVGDTGDSGKYYETSKIIHLKPVINLKPNVLNSGTGSALNPYTIVE